MFTRRIDLRDFSDPLLPKKPITVQEEFFGVYCLVSRNELKRYKNKCYIGYTVDHIRRVRQHNSGVDGGGAKKTDNRGPWDMVCIIHGFPNSISALRFEWAWQNPEKSRRLKTIALSKKERKESPLDFHVRIACHMLNSDPWRRLALTWRWLLPEYQVPFPVNMQPPAHIKIAYGPIQRGKTMVALELNQYAPIKPCYICGQKIEKINHLLRCPMLKICSEHFHVHCLAERCLRGKAEFDKHIFPIDGNCPKCEVNFFWADLVQDQRTLLVLEKNKPEIDGLKLAEGLIPKEMIMK